MKRYLSLIATVVVFSCASQKQSTNTNISVEPGQADGTVSMKNPDTLTDVSPDTALALANSTSFNVANYANADKEISLEREEKLKERQNIASVTEAESLDSVVHNESDSFSITLDESTPEARVVDSIDQIISTLELDLIGNDKRMQRIKSFDIPTAIQYLIFLKKHGYKNDEDLNKAVNVLIAIKREEKIRTTIIMNYLSGNNREIVHRYLKKINAEMSNLSDFLLRLSSNEKIEIEHEKVNPNFFTNY